MNLPSNYAPPSAYLGLQSIPRTVTHSLPALQVGETGGTGGASSKSANCDNRGNRVRKGDLVTMSGLRIRVMSVRKGCIYGQTTVQFREVWASTNLVTRLA